MSAISWAVLDLDGTLTPTSVISHVGERAGFEGEAADLANGYECGLLSNDSVSRQFARHLESWPRHKLMDLLADLPITPGVDGAVERLHQAGIRCMISTATFDFAAEYFVRRYRFDGYYASELHYDELGTCKGTMRRVREVADKRDDLASFCYFYGISSEDVAYIGDGVSDIDALRWSKHSIAFNPTCGAVESAALHTVWSDSLAPAISKIIEWAGCPLPQDCSKSDLSTKLSATEEYPSYFRSLASVIGRTLGEPASDLGGSGKIPTPHGERQRV